VLICFQDTSGPLKGVVIAVCKKLSKNQSEYNNMAVSMGADYRWMYDNSCTHFIFQVNLFCYNQTLRTVSVYLIILFLCYLC